MITIASVVIRHLHKILGEDVRKANLGDLPQRCLGNSCDGNATASAVLLNDVKLGLPSVIPKSQLFRILYFLYKKVFRLQLAKGDNMDAHMS